MTGGSSLRCFGELVVEADFIKYLPVLTHYWVLYELEMRSFS